MPDTKDGGWMPIETAPRDGTEVFVYEPGVANDPDDRGFCDFASWTTGGWKSDRGHSYPTHWMPVPELPAPPTERGRDDAIITETALRAIDAEAQVDELLGKKR